MSDGLQACLFGSGSFVFPVTSTSSPASSSGPDRELAADPSVIPDYVTTDSDGRRIAHLMVGGFIFTYWADHAVQLVMIAEIDDAE